jgi:hypothetical protein
MTSTVRTASAYSALTCSRVFSDWACAAVPIAASSSSETVVRAKFISIPLDGGFAVRRHDVCRWRRACGPRMSNRYSHPEIPMRLNANVTASASGRVQE